MRRSVVLSIVLALLGSLVLVTTVGGGGFWKAPPFSSIGIKNVYDIGNDFDVSGDPAYPILRFYMETGSATEACLVTMGEANHAPTVAGFYCSSRQPILADGDRHWGVMVTLFLAGPLEDVNGDPSWYSVNVYQEGAKFYNDPLRCDLSGC